MLRDMDFVGCDDSTAEFGSTKSNKADQKIYLAKEFQHSLAPILSWNQWIILPNLLDLLLIFIEKKRWYFHCDKKQSRDLDGLQTHDPVPKLDHNLKLRGPPATNSISFWSRFIGFLPFFLGWFFHWWRNMTNHKKDKHHRFFTGKKNRAISRLAGFPITKDLMIEDNKKSQEFQVVRFQFLFESTLVSHEEKTTEIHLGETRFIHQNWPILGQCSLNLLLLEHLCQQWGFQKMTTKNAYVHKVHAKMLMPIDNHPSKDCCSHPNGSLSWLKVHLSVFGKNGLCCFRHKGW